MESPKTGIVLLALVAVTTAAGAVLGWHLRSPAPAIEKAASPVEIPAETPVSLKTQGD